MRSPCSGVHGADRLGFRPLLGRAWSSPDGSPRCCPRAASPAAARPGPPGPWPGPRWRPATEPQRADLPGRRPAPRTGWPTPSARWTSSPVSRPTSSTRTRGRPPTWSPSPPRSRRRPRPCARRSPRLALRARISPSAIDARFCRASSTRPRPARRSGSTVVAAPATDGRPMTAASSTPRARPGAWSPGPGRGSFEAAGLDARPCARAGGPMRSPRTCPPASVTMRQATIRSRTRAGRASSRPPRPASWPASGSPRSSPRGSCGDAVIGLRPGVWRRLAAPGDVVTRVSGPTVKPALPREHYRPQLRQPPLRDRHPRPRGKWRPWRNRPRSGSRTRLQDPSRPSGRCRGTPCAAAAASATASASATGRWPATTTWSPPEVRAGVPAVRAAHPDLEGRGRGHRPRPAARTARGRVHRDPARQHGPRHDGRAVSVTAGAPRSRRRAG